MSLEIRKGREAMDFEKVHAWLTTAYWSLGVSRENVENAANGSSLVLGAFVDGEQVGFARIVSDLTTFAWVCDVFVDERHRGHGIARALVQRALEDPDHQGLRRWLLVTRDAHKVYSKLGFEPLPEPSRWMLKGVQIPPQNGS